MSDTASRMLSEGPLGRPVRVLQVWSPPNRRPRLANSRPSPFPLRWSYYCKAICTKQAGTRLALHDRLQSVCIRDAMAESRTTPPTRNQAEFASLPSRDSAVYPHPGCIKDLMGTCTSWLQYNAGHPPSFRKHLKNWYRTRADAMWTILIDGSVDKLAAEHAHSECRAKIGHLGESKMEPSYTRRPIQTEHPIPIRTTKTRAHTHTQT